MSIRLTGMNSGLDTDAMVKELVNAYEKKGQKTKNEKTKLDWKQEIWTDMNKKIKNFASKVRSLKFESNYAQKRTTSSNESKVSVIAGDKAVRGTQTIKVTSLAKTAYVTSKNLNLNPDGVTERTNKLKGSSTLSELGIDTANSKIKVTQNGKETIIDANADTTISSLVSKLNSAGLDTSFDEKNGRFFISARSSGEASNFSFEGINENVDEDGNKTTTENAGLVAALGLTTASGASVTTGTDAEIYLNGAQFKSSSNSFDINGMAISVKGLTAKGTAADGSDDEVLTLTTDTDVDTIYKNIKGVIKAYSDLVNEISKLYGADSAKGYDPLTDEEKDSMSDEEVEKWEQKIKDSLLRRDSSLSSVKSAMTMSSLSAFEIGGKKYTLSDFGIGTLGYFTAADNEKSALHIDGDEEDEEVSGKTNKLKQMLTADPDVVASFFSKYMTKLTEEFDKISKSSDFRSFGNFYDDKKVKKDLTSYESKISDWEKYVSKIEDKYYSQFTSMEKQLAKLNSTQTSLSSYFGGGM